MEVSREDLAKRFETLSDEEVLQHFQSGTLTPLAIEVAGNVLRSRGVDPLSSPGAADSTQASAVGLDGEGLDLVTVSVEWDPLKANLLRALLESHGIFAYVWGSTSQPPTYFSRTLGEDREYKCGAIRSNKPGSC